MTGLRPAVAVPASVVPLPFDQTIRELVASLIVEAELQQVQQRVRLLRRASPRTAFEHLRLLAQRPACVAIGHGLELLVARRIAELGEKRHHPMAAAPFTV